MKKTLVKSKQGFTIIEVVLVLAIAGLIFLMVFLALPALQRSQRDTQRSDDIARLQSAIVSFSSNNRGKIPGCNGNTDTSNECTVSGSADVASYTETSSSTSSANWPTGSWGYFYGNYLLVGTAGSTDTFEDPDGEPYSLRIVHCSTSKLSAGDDCDNDAQVTDLLWDYQAAGADKSGNEITTTDDTLTEGGTFSHYITIVYNATCQDETSVYSSGSRKIAILYKKEGGGSLCLNN